MPAHISLQSSIVSNRTFQNDVFSFQDPVRACGCKERSGGAYGQRRGLRLIELLVVIAIIGMLVALVAPSALQQLGRAKHKIAQQSITRISGLLDMYRLDVGSYPSTQQGLTALAKQPAGAQNWSGPYIQDAQGLVDPWGNPYQYRAPSQEAGTQPSTYSAGPDPDRKRYQGPHHQLTPPGVPKTRRQSLVLGISPDMSTTARRMNDATPTVAQNSMRITDGLVRPGFSSCCGVSARRFWARQRLTASPTIAGLPSGTGKSCVA